MDDPDQCIRLAVVLQTVHMLGHATRNMILDQLKWQHKIFPHKLIPCVGADPKKNMDVMGKIIKKLLDKGLLCSFDYVTERIGNVLYYIHVRCMAGSISGISYR